MSFAQRTHHSGELSKKNVGQQVVLNGWVHKIRDLGGVCFVELRDRTGICQLTINPAIFSKVHDLKAETCLSVTGLVQERSEDTKNPKMPTGDIEVALSAYTTLGPSLPLPFQLSDEDQMQNVNEELRIKYRYLDLRRPKMYKKLAIRAAIVTKIRKFLDEHGFLEVETPILTKSTPEGARDYLVPFRLEPGLFYALPQSPQQYKQLLMVAGIERYYQIAKCFRDESQRSDRLPEFTQLDLEMSFVTQEDILKLSEELVMSVMNSIIEEFKLDKEPVQPFARLTYDEAMDLYACDKPDLRFDLRIFDITETVRNSEFGVFQNVAQSGGFIRGVRYPGGAQLSRREINQLEEYCKEFGAKGMAYMSVESGTSESGYSSPSGLYLKGPITKFFKKEEMDQILALSSAQPGDLLCFIADGYMQGNNVLARLRNKIGDLCNLKDPRILKFCWITDFPLVEWDEESGRWQPMHHPFTGPKVEDLIYIETDPGRIRAECYDIVCNGLECASGSIRIHRSDIQSRIFRLLGINEETQKTRFGHILHAFQFGAPPHGGIAPGIDRFAILLTNDENIREVIAFPKISHGHDPMMDAPSTIDEEQWQELGIQLTKKPVNLS